MWWYAVVELDTTTEGSRQHILCHSHSMVLLPGTYVAFRLAQPNTC